LIPGAIEAWSLELFWMLDAGAWMFTQSYLLFAGFFDFGASFEGMSFTGNESRKRSNCSFVTAFRTSDLAFSSAESAASWGGAATMCGVKNMMSSVFESLLCVCLKSTPRYGISPSKGILVSVWAFWSWIRPPITTVWPSGVTTTVSAERMVMGVGGDARRDGHRSRGINRRDLRLENHLHHAIVVI